MCLFAVLTVLLGVVPLYLAKPMVRSVQLMVFSEKTTGVIVRTEVIERPASRNRSRSFAIYTDYEFSLSDGQQHTGRALRTSAWVPDDAVGKPVEVYYLRGNPEFSGLYDDFQPDFLLLIFIGPLFAFVALFFAVLWHGFWRFLRT